MVLGSCWCPVYFKAFFSVAVCKLSKVVPISDFILDASKLHMIHNYMCTGPLYGCMCDSGFSFLRLRENNTYSQIQPLVLYRYIMSE